MLSQFLHSDPSRGWGGSGGETVRDVVAHGERIAARIGPVSPGARVVVSCRHAQSFVPALFGSWLSGATVELLPNVQPATLDRVDADSGATAVLHDDPARATRSAKALYVPAVIADQPNAAVRRGAWPELAVRMTTSGTTEQPKYVGKTTVQLVRELAALAQVVPAATCVLSTVPLSHLYGLLWGALLPLRIGARIASHEALLPADVRTVIERERVDMLVSTPAHLRALAAAAMPRDLRVISSGASLDPELHAALAQRHGWHVTDVLGSTETGGIALRTQPTDAWTPLPEVAISAPAHELVVVSPWCEQVSLDEQIELEPDGRFRYLGRNHEVIKIAGKRAHAHAIEAAARGIPGIADAAVVVHSVQGREPRIALAIALANGQAPIARDVVGAAIRASFDAVFVPRLVKVVANIPRTDRGKIDRVALQALFADPVAATHRVFTQRLASGQYSAAIPHDLVFFRGHFDALAILPGAALVERVMWPIVRAEWPAIVRLLGIRRLRFRRPVFPGQQLMVTVTRTAAKVAVGVVCGAASVASAQLLVE